jgi:hypothetical protein
LLGIIETGKGKTSMSNKSNNGFIVILGALAASCILLLALWADYSVGSDEVTKQTNARAMLAVKDAAADLDSFIHRVSMLPITTASRQQILGNTPDPMMVEYLRNTIAKVPKEQVYGIYIAYEDMKWSDKNSMPWMDRKKFPEMTVVHYDYHDPIQDWYSGAKADRKLHITEPYFDGGGSDINMVSVTYPVIAKDEKFVGVAGADLSLELIQNIVDGIETAFWDSTVEGHDEVRHAYLVSRKGLIVTHPDPKLMLSKDSPGAKVESLPDGAVTVSKPEGAELVEIGGEKRRIYWASSGLTGWKLVLNVSDEAVMRPVGRLARKAILIAGLGLGAMVCLTGWIFSRARANS